MVVYFPSLPKEASRGPKTAARGPFQLKYRFSNAIEIKKFINKVSNRSLFAQLIDEIATRQIFIRVGDSRRMFYVVLFLLFVGSDKSNTITKVIENT